MLDKSPLPVPLTIDEAINNIATLHPRNPAIVSGSSQALTFHELHLHLQDFRSLLRQMGMRQSARVGILLPPGPEATLTTLGVACAAIAVPLDPRKTHAELERDLAALSLDALVVQAHKQAELRSLPDSRGVKLMKVSPLGDGQLGLKLQSLPASFEPADVCRSGDSPAFILQTSGTTGRPKLVPYSHASVLAAAARVRDWFGLSSADRCLCVAPPFYSHGLTMTIFPTLLAGGSLAIPAHAGRVDVTEWFDELRPTWCSAAPALLGAVRDAARRLEHPPRHSLRFLVSGGAPLSQDIARELEDIFQVPVLEHLGCTETGPLVANRPPPGPNRPGTCGRPEDGTVLLLNEAGCPVPTGMRGEIWACGQTVIASDLSEGGCDAVRATKGWFRTGDLGSLDEDGFLTLHGRSSEMINRGGEKILPGEVEAALMRHPAVAEAAVFAVPHPRLGEDLAAAVVLKPNAPVEGADLRRFLKNHLVTFKIPRSISIENELPKTLAGKVQRRLLSDAAKSGRGMGEHSVESTSRHEPTALEKELLQVWRRVLNREDLSIDDSFFENGGDSLLATDMILEVEELVGRAVFETILFEADTVRALAPLIANPAGAHSAHADHTSPLFVFHGDYANGGLFLRRLVALLGREHPIFLIDPHGLHGKSAVPHSIEAMAADRLPLILAAQRTGPYLLAGHCNGALVALEAARLLTKAKQSVGWVAMIDAPSACAHPIARFLLRLAKHLRPKPVSALVFNAMTALERDGGISVRAILRATLPSALAKTRDRLHRRARYRSAAEVTHAAYTSAMARYLPQLVDLPVVYYEATYQGQTWRRICPDLEVVKLPGGHHECASKAAEFLSDDLLRRISEVTEIYGPESF